ncbi:MAG TPA: IPExxxVDY family protein [Flavobacterium sp.]|jgi:hypothetical protein
MANFRLSLDEFDEVDYDLIAIHTSLEDYHLAFLINQNFPVLLSRNTSNIQVKTKDGEASFSRFTFDATDSGLSWNLLQNRNESTLEGFTAGGLFSDGAVEVASRAYLLPELKKVDYFLKIENAETDPEDIIERLNSIERISTVYQVNASQIKSKNNIII